MDLFITHRGYSVGLEVSWTQLDSSVPFIARLVFILLGEGGCYRTRAGEIVDACTIGGSNAAPFSFTFNEDDSPDMVTSFHAIPWRQEVGVVTLYTAPGSTRITAKALEHGYMTLREGTLLLTVLPAVIALARLAGSQVDANVLRLMIGAKIPRLNWFIAHAPEVFFFGPDPQTYINVPDEDAEAK